MFPTWIRPAVLVRYLALSVSMLVTLATTVFPEKKILAREDSERKLTYYSSGTVFCSALLPIIRGNYLSYNTVVRYVCILFS